MIEKLKTVSIGNLLQLYHSQPACQALSVAAKQYANIQIKGLCGSAASLSVASLFQQLQTCCLVIMDDMEMAGYFYNDLLQMLGSDFVLFFPSAYRRDIRFGQIDAASEILRIDTLNKLSAAQTAYIAVTYPEAIAERVVSKESLKQQTLTLKSGEKVDVKFISEVLESFGFEYTDYVYEPGQYAFRGSIVDVFSFSNEYPYRIDFFGDEIESIRSFDVESQLSQQRHSEISIIPQLQSETLATDCFLNFLPNDTVVVYNDYSWIEARLKATADSPTVLGNPEYDRGFEKKLIAPDAFRELIAPFKQICTGKNCFLTPQCSIEFETEHQPLFHKNFDLVAHCLSSYSEKGYKIYILSDSEKQHKRLFDIFSEQNSGISFIPVDKTLHEGFIDHRLKALLFTDHQIFDRFHKYSLKSEKARSGKIALSLKEIKQFQIGDYVVHIDHGIGKFGGLVCTDINGSFQEMVKINYSNNDTIFVSIHALHKISKYRGKEGEAPRISRLGSGAWERIKEKTKKHVKEIARDLILLYSKRRQEKGFAYSPDSFLQHELEASFIYEDTPDQEQATNDVKRDMESERPMDRLICGDVGFGKTEVAIRAAFKAVSDNKQVAVLVPTTVLAAQHFHTFNDRLKDFPCRVDYISRARSAAQIKAILKDLKERKIDILIGTHRLVSKDVVFNDLGLLIIDEEQKFGVSVKEKLKMYRNNVDVITMTATPIPRTLEFSLMGARDLSTITTAPPNRYPIYTELQPFDMTVIQEAINFEMSRNGQTFIINNRIHNIYDLETAVRKAVPDARIAVAHGQMEPAKLENIITDFVNYEFDVLIATAIIESGLDIPNANTMIVNNAQNFGLSDLHQLRGRVGRSNRKAFCYLLTPPLHLLSSEARRKLQAIENFSELGSGINVAMQDLDIRGAGNLLGSEQSGFIADLGFETYQKILTEAVNELKIEEFAELFYNAVDNTEKEDMDYVHDVAIESDLELLFPVEYIPNDSERITIYRELDSITHRRELDRFISKLEDRFGKIPPESMELLKVFDLRKTAKKLGIEKIFLKQGYMKLFMIANRNSPFYRSALFGNILSFVQQYPKRCKLDENKDKLTLRIKGVESVAGACAILEEISRKEG